MCSSCAALWPGYKQQGYIVLYTLSICTYHYHMCTYYPYTYAVIRERKLITILWLYSVYSAENKTERRITSRRRAYTYNMRIEELLIKNMNEHNIKDK